MGGTRALFGSIGAGVSLVAAAALSLLALSALLAFGGWSDAQTASLTPQSIVFDRPTLSDATVRGKVARRVVTRPVVVTAAAPPARARASARIGRPADAAVLVRRKPVIAQIAPAPAPALTPPVQRPARPVVASVVEPTADIVRELGDDLSATVQSAGQALGAATAPLGPPVSAAVQNVLNIIAALLKDTTHSLAAAVEHAAR